MSAWLLSDGAAGNERQVLALGEALGLEARLLRLQASGSARWLAPRFGRLDAIRRADGQPLAPPWPEFAIGCGRVAALATRRLRERGVRSVQILDPRVDPKHFDVVVAPRHDALRGTNVVSVTGSLHPIDDAWLDAARGQIPALATRPSPRTAVLVGGPSRQLRWRRRDLDAMIAILRHWQARDGGSLLVACSRRTPAWAERQLRRDFPDAFPAATDASHWYPALLASADRIVVSGDSVNMLTEACAVGVPVLYAVARTPRERLARFHHELLEAGHARPLRLEFRPWSNAPLRELPTLAAAVAQRLGLA